MIKHLTNLIQQHFISHKMTLSLAESCTGGKLASSITLIPGCSQYFLGSIVAYSDALKKNLLGVDSKILYTYGAVSAPVVNQMAQGVIKLTGSDYSIAVSGIAGPAGGTSLIPVGTIWAAIAKKGEEPFTWEFSLSGSRREIIEKCVVIILSQMWSLIKSKEKTMYE